MNKNLTKALALLALGIPMSFHAGAASLSDGLVSYWPLDDVAGTKTPDVISGYDMELVNLSAADLVTGKTGKAFHFDNARQTMLTRVSTAGEQLPINQHPALTIAMWVNVTGTGQSDLRLFSEGSQLNNNPLFNLGTDNGGGSGQLDYYFRQSGWGTVNHLKSTEEPLDGTWRHIAFVQQADGTRTLFVDGVADGTEIPAKEEGNWRIETTTIGGILRANPTHWVTGDIDEVMVWSRALAEAEVKTVVSEGLNSVINPLTKGMVAYWPLDEVVGVKTPDVASGYDMDLVNLSAADLVTGKHGKAFHFDNAKQTMLTRVSTPGEQLPINQHPALTISMWVNVTGTGQSDLRLFSEGSQLNNNPLFNLGTSNSGGSGQVDYYLRQTGWATVDHLKSTAEPLDGTWHHIAFVQEEDGTRVLYVDGVADETEIPAKEPGTWNVGTTTIGGILRANPTHWVTGDIDDVALWSRALSQAEVVSIVNNGTPTPFAKAQPLAIRSFDAFRSSVAAGSEATLRWDVTKNVEVSIDGGVGDVTAKTISGTGSVKVPMTASKTFTLTLKRGEETLTAQTTVSAIDGVAAGWTLVDNFDTATVGLLNGQNDWAVLDAIDLEVVEEAGNKYAAPNAGGATASLSLGDLTVKEGEKATIFFRILTRGDIFEPVRGLVALTDRPVRFGGDIGPNIGPGAALSDEFGEMYAGMWEGPGSTLEFGNYDFPLTRNAAYNIWVDITNGPFEGPADARTSTGDLSTIYASKVGDSTRKTILTDWLSARDPIGAADVGFTTPDLTRMIIGGMTGHSTTVNFLIDDIYISHGGFNSTLPRAAGVTTPIPPVVVSEPPTLAFSRAAGQIEISWKGGNLESATSITGPWAAVAGATSPRQVAPSGPSMFYRVRQ
ncbi:MAG: LamG domain-containing protein [Verrucomicrobia bacterium]|nr:LamG domain-containing protein [Verrucomicrobiota bacterium]